MRTVVSGGTGYVGRFIVEKLLTSGHEVIVLGRNKPPSGFFSKSVQFYSCNLEPSSIDISPFIGADHFVHAAFHHVKDRYRGGEGDDPETFKRRNLDGSIALFKAAKSASVRKIIFLSSRAVYGPLAVGKTLSEEDQTTPDTLYGQIKLLGEQALFQLSDATLQTTSLRVTGVYGVAPNSGAHKWRDLIADYLSGKPIVPRIGTEVHGNDLADAITLLLQHQGCASAIVPQVLNVSDIMLDRRDLLALVQGFTACPHPLPQRADARTVTPMTSAKLLALGWKPGGLPLLEQSVPSLLSSV